MSPGPPATGEPHGSAQRRTLLVWHERFRWYETGLAAAFVPAGGLVQPHRPVDTPDPKQRLHGLLEVSGLMRQLIPRVPFPATDEQILTFHTREYVDRLKAFSATGHGEAGFAAEVGPDGYETAALAVGGSLAAVDAVLSGDVDNAYALVRPCGHHARPDEGVGSCLLANGVLATLHARSAYSVERVAIIDWDVHHGNSAQEAFWEDGDTLTVSLHQSGMFPPGSGELGERGAGAGLGANLNVPLPAGSGHGAYLEVASRVLEPLLRRHQPDLIVVASGFDAAAMDPMGRMMLHSETFRALTRLVRELAEELCGGRLVLLQEGGYSAVYTPFCGLAVVEELAGVPPAPDPFLATFVDLPGQAVTPAQVDVVQAACQMLETA